jgi:hypothetical protein
MMLKIGERKEMPRKMFREKETKEVKLGERLADVVVA